MAEIQWTKQFPCYRIGSAYIIQSASVTLFNPSPTQEISNTLQLRMLVIDLAL